MKRTRGYIIAVHCISWLIFLSLPAIFVAGLSGTTKLSALLRPSAWLYFTVYIFIFYLHTNFLYPKLYFRKKYILYTTGVCLMAATVFYLSPFEKLAHMEKRKWAESHSHKDEMVRPGPGHHEINTIEIKKNDFPLSGPGKAPGGMMIPKMDIVSIVLFIMIMALSVTIVTVRRWRLAIEQVARAESEKVSAELRMLKAQINPHFLFNTLNNIYFQAIMKDEHTAESIMKLSNIMRYVTDDAKEEFVSLISEANFISDYIELQRLRLGSKVTLDFSISGELENKLIAPLILITFIENVFKYGISNNEASVITIGLKAEDNSINFFCRNRLFPLKLQLEGTRIGIVNTRKRLEHLYPGKHVLNIREADGFFSVYLILQC